MCSLVDEEYGDCPFDGGHSECQNDINSAIDTVFGDTLGKAVKAIIDYIGLDEVCDVLCPKSSVVTIVIIVVVIVVVIAAIVLMCCCCKCCVCYNRCHGCCGLLNKDKNAAAGPYRQVPSYGNQ